MRVRLTPRAEADLDGISAYLEPRNPQGARRVEAALQEALAILAQYPKVGHGLREGVRRLPLPRYPYLIFYRLNEAADEVDVLPVRHAARREESQDEAP